MVIQGGREGSLFSQGEGGGCANASLLSRFVNGHIEDAGHGADVIGDFNEIVLVPAVNVFNDTTVMDVFQSPPCGLTQVTAWWQRTGKTRPSPSKSPPQVWGTTTRGSDIPGRAPRERWAQRSRGQQSQPAGQ